MDYDAVLEQAIVLLQREQRLSYRVLKRRLQLDDEMLEDLKEDLIYAKQLAVDEEGKCWWTRTPGPRWLGGCRARVARNQVRPAPIPPRGAPSYATSLGRAHPGQQQALEARGANGERKTITALFADIRAPWTCSKTWTRRTPAISSTQPSRS